ncbi:hypothetical protein [Aeromicrobium sp. NPDC092404]|uniref:hypothetical protein n=1 Tax=Aeromicrobium sp. NPDC092404 TaxID=3154976 RepID=UPI0034172270
MTDLRVRTSTTAGWAAVAAVATVLMVLVMLGPWALGTYALMGLLAAFGLWVVAVHPQSVFRFTGFVLAGAPLIPAPGLGAPLILILGLAVWVVLMMAVRPAVRLGWVEALVALSVVVSGISVLMTSPDLVSIVEYGRWVIAFALVIPLRLLGAKDLVSFGRAYVAGACFGSAVGMLLVAVDRQGYLLDQLTAFGYDVRGGNLRVVRGSEETSLRLTSTYVDPNMGGFVLVVGLVLAVALLRGVPRVVVSAIIGGAVLLTLSRTSIATAAVAFVVIVVLGNVGMRARVGMIVAVAASAVVGLAIPAVRLRLLDSFGPTDAGTQARQAAFNDYVDAMRGQWWFGKGWGIEEFRDPTVGQVTNFVANAPLLTVYRAGVIVGLIFVALLVAGMFRSVRLLQTGTFPQAVVAAGFVAVALVALQLDFPVALLPPATMAFGVLLAYLSHDRWADELDREAA